MRKTARWLVAAMLVMLMACSVHSGWAEEVGSAGMDTEHAVGMENGLTQTAQEPVGEQEQSVANEATSPEPGPVLQPETQPEQDAPEESAAPDMTDPSAEGEEQAEKSPLTPETALTVEPSALSEEEPAQSESAEDVGGALSNILITVWLDGDGPLSLGDTVVLKSRIEGIQPDSVYTLQWQYFDGSQWFDEPGATADTCRITVTEINAGYLWRLAVQAA